MSIHRNFIAGAWVEGDVVTRNINPSDTRNLIGEYARASRLQAESAIAAMSAAQPPWAASSPQQRSEVLERLGREFLSRRAERSELLAREEGKPLALGPCSELVNSTRAGMEVEIAREAVGVVWIITPRNFPIAIPTWKIAPAPAHGNMGRPRSLRRREFRQNRWPSRALPASHVVCRNEQCHANQSGRDLRPVASVIRVGDLEEALAGQLHGLRPLSGCDYHIPATRQQVQAKDPGRLVMVNAPTTGVDPHVPFGGRKASSYGSP